MIEANFNTHYRRGIFNLWLLPDIEVNHEHFPSDGLYREYRFIAVTIAWLFWSLEIEYKKMYA